MDKTEIVKCLTCGKDSTKLSKELARQRKRGRSRFYCSRSCSIIASNRATPHGNLFRGHETGRQLDELSPFRWFVARIRTRDRKHLNRGRKDWEQGGLTPQDLSRLWATQKGVCPFTKWEMRLPRGSDGGWKENPRNASLDRVDSRFGYVSGNVRFVCCMANYARHSFSDQELLEFCKAVTQCAT